MSESQDVIVRDSDKRFRLRISGFLRSLGISQIIGTNAYLDIEFIGGNSVRVLYPSKLEDLSNTIESELLLETQLTTNEIDNIRSHIYDYIVEIEEVIGIINNSQGHY